MATTSQARAVLATEWHTEVLDTGAIHDEIGKLWDQLGDQASVSPLQDESEDEINAPRSGLMRATTLNLIAVARNDRDARLIGETISHLRDFLPSRTIILIIRKPEHADDAVNFSVKVELREQQLTKEKGEEGLKFETITIGADQREVGRLASLVSPLLMSELPNYLWWPSGDYQTSPLFHDLVEIVDRLVVDSAQLGRDLSGVAALRELVDGDAGTAIVGDFTWLRLGTWRQLIAQFFDPEEVQKCLDTIDQVTIAYANTRSDGSSGLPAALLTVGWLASLLDWEIIDPLERQKSGVYWAPLRSRRGDRQRDIQVRLIPDPSSQAKFSLRRVEIVAKGEHSGTFRVERTDDDDLITSSEMPTAPLVSRMVYSKRPTNETMLASELQRFGADKVLEETLRFATGMLP